jgi:hypothetical protein
MGTLRIRPLVGVALILTNSLLSGCADVFPSFAGVFGVGSTVEQLPVTRVTARVACELREFFQKYEEHAKNDPNTQLRLDRTQAASVSLSLQTDLSGSVQYTGIDLSKVGLTSLANLITVTKGVPSLSAKAQPKTTVSAQIDIALPQTDHDRTFTTTDAKTGKTTTTTIPGLGRVCPTEPLYVQNPLEKLYLADWLEAFFTKTENENDNYENNLKYVCLSKITLKTSFTIALDVSAGANPFFGAAYLLPVNGVTLDFNPDLVHSLQIVLALKNSSNSPLCSKTTQPNVVISGT